MRKEKGLTLEEGQDLLDQEKIKYEEETKKTFSLFVGKDKIVKTEPNVGEEIKAKEKVTIYQSRSKLILIIMLIQILFQFLLTKRKNQKHQEKVKLVKLAKKVKRKSRIIWVTTQKKNK